MEIVPGICGGGTVKKGHLLCITLMGFVSLGIVGPFALFIPTLTQEEGRLYSNIKVKMYVLGPRQRCTYGGNL